MNFIEYVKENKKEFALKVTDICNQLNIKPEWLMFVMWFESRLNPQAVNPISGSTGLIQFRVLPDRHNRRRLKL